MLNLKLLLSFSMILLLTACGSAPVKNPNFGDLVKGQAYTLGNIRVELSTSRIGGDKTIKYLSQSDLQKFFKKHFVIAMKSKGRITSSPSEAQAKLDVAIKFTRTFVAFTNRRMNPHIEYTVHATRDEKPVAHYESDYFTKTSGMYQKKSDDDELAVLGYFADRIAKRIEKMEK